MGAGSRHQLYFLRESSLSSQRYHLNELIILVPWLVDMKPYRKNKKMSGLKSGFNSIRSMMVESLESTKNSVSTSHVDVFFRVVRAVVGSVILLTIVTAILIPQVLPVSGNSYVNAKLEWIRTPIEGDLQFGDLKVGDKVSEGTVIGTVTNTRADDYFLNQLNSEKSGLDSLLFSLENRRRHLVDRSEVLRGKIDESLADLEVKTRIRLEIIENELAQATEEKGMIRTRLERYKKANRKYKGEESFAIVSRVSLEKLSDRERELETSINSQQTTINLLQSNLESALKGNFVSENTPLEQQQLLEIEQSLMSIDAEIESLTLKAGNLSNRLNSRLEHLKKNTHYELVAGVSGTLWDIGFPDGSYVNHGDSVVAIADTSTLSVEGNFHQRYLDNIKVGDPATIDLMGSSEKLSGVVSEVKIRDQIKSADLSAFNLSSPATNEFKVVVTLDQQQGHDPYIGQRAKVIISKSRTSVMPSLLLLFN